MLSTRIFVLLLVTLLAARYALTEAARVEEIARLREKVALGDYRVRLSREMEVLELLGEGLRNRQIAERLFISEKTVKNHMSSILTKPHVNDRTQAALLAARHGLTDPLQSSNN